MSIKYVELFAGIGGLSEGFKLEGASCVFANEYDKYAAQTYEANNSISVDRRDIREVRPEDIPGHDILLAGFPCQPFSIAGISKRRALGRATGMDCKDQGNLFFEAARIIAAHEPKAVVFENVKNLINHDGGNTFLVIKGTLEKLGYAVSARVLNAAAWVPQNRQRIFIIGVKGKDALSLDKIEVPIATEWPKLEAILHKSDGVEVAEHPYTRGSKRLCVSPKYVLTDHMWKYLQDYKRKHEAKGNGFGFGLVGPSDSSRTLSARYYKDGSEILIKRRGNPRRLTPRECARLMGFDSSRTPRFKIPVSDNQAYKQFGNAVVVPMSRAIAKTVLPCL